MSLFVGRIPRDARTRDLENLFEKFGKMKRCEVKEGKGFGFIEFEDKRDAEDAIKDGDRLELMGSRIVVEWAKGEGRGTGSGTRTNGCFKCGGEGHWARECPEAGGGGGGYVSRDRDRDRRRSRSPYRGGGRERDFDRGSGRDRDYDRGGRDYDRGSSRYERRDDYGGGRGGSSRYDRDDRRDYDRKDDYASANGRSDENDRKDSYDIPKEEPRAADPPAQETGSWGEESAAADGNGW